MKKLILVIIPFFLCGCTTYTELGDLSVVNNMGIDYSNNSYHVVLTNVEKKEQEYSYQNLSSSGKTLQEALDNIKIQDNKKIYIAHLNTLILTPNAINYKLKETLEFFLKNTESRNDFSIALADDLSILQEEKSQEIKEKIQTIEKDLGTTKEIAFEEFLKDILEENTTHLPLIKKEQENIVVDSITLINQNKTSYHLTKEECVLYNLLNNSIEKTNFENTTIKSSKSLTRFKNQEIHIVLQLTVIEEEKELSNQLQRKIKEMFEKYREKNIDIFHFMRQIEIQNNSLFKEHKDTLLDHINLKFNIKITSDTNKKIEVNLP